MLASPELRATIHPDRGGDIASLVHLPAGIELLWQAPWPERQGPIPSDAQFDAWYAGGWQDLLPNGNEACVVDGVRHAFHGETWRREWQARRDGDAVELSLALETLALSVVRRIQVDGPSLVVAERVRNEGEAPVRCMWGQHPALGGGLLEPGCRIEVAGGTTLGYHELLEPRSRLGMGWRDRWPIGRTGAGDLLDLRDVPGPDARVHDVVLLTDLDEGRVAVVNPRLRLRFELVFPGRRTVRPSHRTRSPSTRSRSSPGRALPASPVRSRRGRRPSSDRARISPFGSRRGSRRSDPEP